jgi:very-short-patch-repair endonuclease
MKNNYSKLKYLARNLRNNQTKSEKKFWRIVKERKFHNLRFLRQKIITEFIADFYCYELRIIIEIDGGIHKKLKERDKFREDFLEEIKKCLEQDLNKK